MGEEGAKGPTGSETSTSSATSTSAETTSTSSSTTETTSTSSTSEEPTDIPQISETEQKAIDESFRKEVDNLTKSLDLNFVSIKKVLKRHITDWEIRVENTQKQIDRESRDITGLLSGAHIEESKFMKRREKGQEEVARSIYLEFMEKAAPKIREQILALKNVNDLNEAQKICNKMQNILQEANGNGIQNIDYDAFNAKLREAGTTFAGLGEAVDVAQKIGGDIIALPGNMAETISLSSEEGLQKLTDAINNAPEQFSKEWMENPDFRKALTRLESVASTLLPGGALGVDYLHNEYEIKPKVAALEEPPPFDAEGSPLWNTVMESATNRLKGLKSTLQTYVKGVDERRASTEALSLPVQEIFNVTGNQRETARQELQAHGDILKIAKTLIDLKEEHDKGENPEATDSAMEIILNDSLQKMQSAHPDYAAINRELAEIEGNLAKTEEVLKKIDNATDYIPGPPLLKIAKGVVRLSTGQTTPQDFALDLILSLVGGKALKVVGGKALSVATKNPAVQRLAANLAGRIGTEVGADAITNAVCEFFEKDFRAFSKDLYAKVASDAPEDEGKTEKA